MPPKTTRKPSLPVVNTPSDVCVPTKEVDNFIIRMSRKDMGNGFTLRAGWELCLRVAQGESIRDICKLSHMPPLSVVLGWIYPDPDDDDPRLVKFSTDYRRAKSQANELLMDDLVQQCSKARDRDDAAVAKTRLDAVKFRLERTEADKYSPTSRVLKQELLSTSGQGGDAFADQLDSALTKIQARRAARMAELSKDSEHLAVGAAGGSDANSS